jgi:hypothetical protein
LGGGRKADSVQAMGAYMGFVQGAVLENLKRSSVECRNPRHASGFAAAECLLSLGPCSTLGVNTTGGTEYPIGEHRNPRRDKAPSASLRLALYLRLAMAGRSKDLERRRLADE